MNLKRFFRYIRFLFWNQPLLPYAVLLLGLLVASYLDFSTFNGVALKELFARLFFFTEDIHVAFDVALQLAMSIYAIAIFVDQYQTKHYQAVASSLEKLLALVFFSLVFFPLVATLVHHVVQFGLAQIRYHVYANPVQPEPYWRDVWRATWHSYLLLPACWASGLLWKEKAYVKGLLPIVFLTFFLNQHTLVRGTKRYTWKEDVPTFLVNPAYGSEIPMMVLLFFGLSTIVFGVSAYFLYLNREQL